MRISDWSSDVCSSDLAKREFHPQLRGMDLCSDRAEGEPWLLRRFDRADLDRCSREASGKGDRFRRRKHILPVCELQGGARELKRVQPRIDRGRTADPAEIGRAHV